MNPSLDDYIEQGREYEALGKARKANGKAGQSTPAAASPERILDPRDPLKTARKFVADHFTGKGIRLLHHHRGDFYRWTGTYFEVVDDAAIRTQVYEYCERSAVAGDDKTEPFKPTTRKVSDILDALRSAAHLSSKIEPPSWLAEATDLPSGELIPCANGLLHLSDGHLIACDPEFFNVSALPFAFDVDAPQPVEWLGFLDSILHDDVESIATLQEMFGYFLTTDTRQQKIFGIVGPRRSGKGTIGRVVRAMLGPANVEAPSLASLGTQFGLAPLIHKRLATISDARLSHRTDTARVLETLLSISGEDDQTADRKFREPWTGRFPTRFLILTNELPKLQDSSGAFAGRFILIVLRESFFGREDEALTDRLLTELPSIFKWSLDGLQRLRERRRFVLPESSREAVQDLEDLSSPVGAFVRDRCEVAPGREIECENLFKAWKSWCQEQGRDHTGTIQVFGRDLQAAVPGVRTRRPRVNGERIRSYEGIRLVDF